MKAKFDFHLNHEEKIERKKALDNVSSLLDLRIKDLQTREWTIVYEGPGWVSALNIGMIGNTLYIVSHDSGQYEVVENINTEKDLRHGLSNLGGDYISIVPRSEPISEADFADYDETDRDEL